MEADGPFDRRLRRLRRDRSARSVRPDYLKQLVDEELAERLEMVSRSFRDVLILGASTLTGRLRGQDMAITTADPGFIFATRCEGVQCDEDRLPFADGSFDLVLAPGTLDSVNDLPGALTLIRRILRPAGL